MTLLRSGTDTVETLAERTKVSTSTVRRDLAQLQATGRIARTYGGAIAREPFHERSFVESEQVNQEAKAAIARAAYPLVPTEPGATVFLDAGTTCLALARLLADGVPRTVVTRGLEAALLLARVPDTEVVVVGGQVRPLSHGIVGPLASLAFARLSFDVAFLGADAIDVERGLGEPTLEETYVKEQAAARGEGVVVLADSSKLAPTNAPAWIALRHGWRLVTDQPVGAEALAVLEASGVGVVSATT